MGIGSRYARGFKNEGENIVENIACRPLTLEYEYDKWCPFTRLHGKTTSFGRYRGTFVLKVRKMGT
jgi:hypothetical protein